MKKTNHPRVRWVAAVLAASSLVIAAC